MSNAQFAYIWRFTIVPERRQEFLAAYGPEGEWASLFRLDAHYLKTDLMQDADHPDQYLTIDYWTSKSARDAFRLAYAVPFTELDDRCEAFTRGEAFIGDFVLVP